MKRGKYYLIGLLFLFFTVFFMGCEEMEHTHRFEKLWATDGEYHWRTCIDCGENVDKAAHLGGNATCTQKAECDVCKKAYGEGKVHTYTERGKDENGHWLACITCGEVDEQSKEEHGGGIATCQQKGKCTTCNEVYGEFGSHEYTVKGHDERHHFNKCILCGAVDEDSKTIHYGETATCQQKSTCLGCGEQYGDFGNHNYTVDGYDETNHYKKCICGEIDEQSRTAHYGGTATCLDAATCEGCNQKYGGKGDHVGGSATCTKKAICDTCKQGYGELDSHAYTVDSSDDKEHFKKCICGEIDEQSQTAHYGGTATCLKEATCEGCNQKYGGKGDHVGGSATCTKKAVCDTCKQEYGELLSHSYTEEKRNDTYIWKECLCGKVDENSKKEIVTDGENNGNNGEADGEDYAELEGNGSDIDPYILTDSCNVKIIVEDYNIGTYFSYESTAYGNVSFSNLNNIDDASIEYGEEYNMEDATDPENIEIEEGKTYYFLLYAPNNGEASFTFTVTTD